MKFWLMVVDLALMLAELKQLSIQIGLFHFAAIHRHLRLVTSTHLLSLPRTLYDGTILGAYLFSAVYKGIAFNFPFHLILHIPIYSCMSEYSPIYPYVAWTFLLCSATTLVA